MFLLLGIFVLAIVINIYTVVLPVSVLQLVEWQSNSKLAVNLATVLIDVDGFRNTVPIFQGGRYVGGFRASYYFPRLPSQSNKYAGYAVAPGSIPLNGYFPVFPLDSVDYLGKYPVMVLSINNWVYV